MNDMKECLLCGNEKKTEIEPTTLYSDADGNDAEETIYICKEGKGCSQ